jgi:hypothetical protein
VQKEYASPLTTAVVEDGVKMAGVVEKRKNIFLSTFGSLSIIDYKRLNTHRSYDTALYSYIYIHTPFRITVH